MSYKEVKILAEDQEGWRLEKITLAFCALFSIFNSVFNSDEMTPTIYSFDFKQILPSIY